MLPDLLSEQFADSFATSYGYGVELVSGLEKMIRKVVSEELKKALFIPFEPAARNPETEESETEILEFLETF